MRHRVASTHLNRGTKQRKALMKNLAQSVVMHGAVVTTTARAKVIKSLLDKIIHRAQEGTIAARRVLSGFFGSRSIVNRLVDEVAPTMKDRASGFTRIVKIGKRRGDSAEVVRLELVKKPEPRVEEKKVTPKESVAKTSATKSAKKPTEAKVEVKAK